MPRNVERGFSLICVVSAACLLVACSAQSDVEPLPPEAKAHADRFVRALVVDEDLSIAARYWQYGTEDLESLGNSSRALKRAGFNEVAGSLSCLEDEPYKPDDAETKFDNCVVYQLEGPRSGDRPTEGTLKVCMERDDGMWKVSSFVAGWD